MPATAINSAVFRDIFTTAAMRAVFSDENRVQKYLDFEAALARAQARARHHPEERRRRDRPALQRRQNRLRQAQGRRPRRIGYPVLPVVQQLVALCKDGLGEWCALGRHHAGHHRHRDGHADPRGARPVEKEIDGIADALATLAKKYRDTPMAGRSNLQQAVPITFGYKMATCSAPSSGTSSA